MSFGHRVRAGIPTVLFEIVPPDRNASPTRIAALVDLAVNLCQTGKVDGINLPEIRAETGSGRLLPKFQPRIVTKMIRNQTRGEICLIINRGIPYLPISRQKKWLIRTYREFGIRNLIIVGGIKKPSAYPGWSVTEAARFITCDLKKESPAVNYFCGGICIPQRRFPNSPWDEPRRLIEKAEAGIEFFTTQVIFDSASICRFLLDYDRLCRQENQRPKMIFLSFAPISCPQDLRFLKKLKVKFSPSLEKAFLKTNPDPVSFSCQLTTRIFSDILNFIKKYNLNIPLGLNIEYITTRNIGLAQELIASLRPLLIKNHGT